MNKDQKKGILLLVLFWISSAFFLRDQGEIVKESVMPLEPLTVTEKILFGFSLSLNGLSEQDWELLPGIGPSTAKKIVEYQTMKGSIQTIDELDELRGIGPKTVQALRQFFDAHRL